MTFPELALFAISFENLRQEEAAAASRDPYGYLFGDRRIWVPVSVSDGSANISTAQQVDPFAQSALGDSVTGAVTLSNPGVTDVTATSAKPKVTVEF